MWVRVSELAPHCPTRTLSLELVTISIAALAKAGSSGDAWLAGMKEKFKGVKVCGAHAPGAPCTPQ